MTDKENTATYPEASLGVVSTDEGLRRADGTKSGEMGRGCPTCNRDNGRPSASEMRHIELPLESEEGARRGKQVVQVVVDYCPHCGRVYDVRCTVP